MKPEIRLTDRAGTFVLTATSVLTAILIGTVPAAASSLCFVPAPNGNNVSVECDILTVWDNDWAGYATDPAERCTSEPGLPGFIPCPQVSPWTGSPYGFTLSTSDVYHDLNFGPLTGTPAVLYLWYACGSAVVSAAEFSIGGDLNVLAFVPMNGFLNAGSATDLLLAAPCTNGPVVAGMFFVEEPVSVESETWGGVKSLYRSH
ncbi:MAG: hypothetical protein HKN12_09680 [Gemmatimonadetes bacterium]|nr:hypothetical protein [Gemmatimonadota bacterium]